MKTVLKLTLSALSLAAFAGLAGCVAPSDEDYDGGSLAYNDGYCDAWGCPDGYWGYPVYYGSIYYNGAWLDGPIYCRDIDGRRQFWVHGGWHTDGWRGDRPAQYPVGHVGPALGRDFYRSAAFSGGNGNRNNTFRDNDTGISGQRFQGNGNNSGNSNSRWQQSRRRQPWAAGQPCAAAAAIVAMAAATVAAASAAAIVAMAAVAATVAAVVVAAVIGATAAAVAATVAVVATAAAVVAAAAVAVVVAAAAAVATMAVAAATAAAATIMAAAVRAADARASGESKQIPNAGTFAAPALAFQG